MRTFWAILQHLTHANTHQGYLIRAFGLLVLAGTVLLALPMCQARPLALTDSFFIATSAVCVTGLSTINFATDLTTAGQLITLILMQLGGLGIITFAALAFKIVGSQISITSQAALTDSIMQKDAAGIFKEVFTRILLLLLGVETLGALFLTADRYIGARLPLAQAAWEGVFHAVSAFCNAGFSLYGNSLHDRSVFFCTVVLLLIFCGGLGQVALAEIAHLALRWFRPAAGAHRRFSYNTAIVLIISLAMIFLGTAVVVATNYSAGREIGGFAALFHGVSSRTAGFTCFSTELLTRTEKLITIFLMFVGGSPGSCAGGIKTTTFAIWLATAIALLRNREECTFLGRQIPKLVVERARQLIQFTLLWNIFGVFLLCLTEQENDMLTLIFEQVSAFGTVGLSLDFTPHLSQSGKLWICLCMFVGRMGPLTLALSIAPLRREKVSHPEGQIMIG